MEPKVIDFPTRRKRTGKTGDEKLADDVMKTWRAFWRAVERAEGVGLHVDDSRINKFISPTVTRRF